MAGRRDERSQVRIKVGVVAEETFQHGGDVLMEHEKGLAEMERDTYLAVVVFKGEVDVGKLGEIEETGIDFEEHGDRLESYFLLGLWGLVVGIG